jgi:hypothetical protein
MRRAFLVALFAAAGCGPLPKPMPDRLDAQAQKEIDAAWDAALAPVGRYDRRRWLDALVGTHAYQAGVDTFTMRSEKRFAGGRVVMEVHFDRAKPDDDRFVVTVFDQAGAVARQERYSRAEVEETARDLFPDGRAGDRAAAAEARWKGIEELLPKPADGKR